MSWSKIFRPRMHHDPRHIALCRIDVVKGGVSALLIVLIALGIVLRLWQAPIHAQSTVSTFTLTIEGAGRGSGKVTSSDDNINCTIVAGAVSGDCTENYEQGTYITLTATPDPGSSFIRWSGDCSGTSPSIIVGINRNMTCIATFGPPRLLFEEDFSAGIPSTWQVVDGGSGGGAASTWTTENPGNRNLGPPFVEPFAIVDSDAAGPGATQDEQLITPWISVEPCPGNPRKVFISFSDYMIGLEVEKADVDISVDGTSWVRKHGWRGWSYPVGPRTTILNLTNELAGATSFKVRFHYYDASYDYYWAIDNVRVFCEDPSLGIENYLLYLPLVLRMR
ncbi:InlB B-repeat-containing protein [Thermoflexus hugenholtzii]